jgi:hypothetical protein
MDGIGSLEEDKELKDSGGVNWSDDSSDTEEWGGEEEGGYTC